MEKFTKQRVLLTIKFGADWVKTEGPSKGSSIGFEILEVEPELRGKIDCAVAVWLFDRYLADLINSIQDFHNFSSLWETHPREGFQAIYAYCL